MSVLENTKTLIKRSAMLRTYQACAFIAGIIKIVLGVPLCIPTLEKRIFPLVNRLNEAFGLGGKEIAVSDRGIDLFLLHLSGVLLVALGAMLIWASRRPIARLKVPAILAVPNLLTAGLIVYHVVAHELFHSMFAFAGIDLAFAGVFLYCYFGLKNKV
ncbi:MAG: hypothetical protein ACYS47_13615 [Planctomycetota bacterium]|jgi:hypothetical protein